MSHSRLSGLFFALSALACWVAAPSSSLAAKKAEPYSPCPSWQFSEPVNPALSDMEKRLICGDPKQGDSPSEGWRSIPRPQGRFNIRNFLQERGYLHPQFKSPPGSEREIVELGPKTRVTALTAENEPDFFDLGRKRKVVGATLTPKLLDGTEKWATSRMGSLGYACSKVTSQADADTGKITLKLDPGALDHVLSVDTDPVPELAPGVFRRYDAFEVGDLYDSELTTLSENRTIADQLVLSTHFVPECLPDGGVRLHQQVVIGPPRLVSVGGGVNTEGLFTLKASWRTLRINPNASNTEISIQASQPLQLLTGLIRWYPSPGRFDWKPQIQIRHDNETSYEAAGVQARIDAETTRDHGRFGWTYTLGPSVDFFRTLRGFGPADARLVSLEARVIARTHSYEFFSTSPRAGFQSTFSAKIANPRFFSDITANRLRLDYEGLWNIRNYDPPLFVLGVRGAVTTILTPEHPGPGSAIPIEYLEYLGGSQDLRGFGRKELSSGGGGALSSLFTDFEARLANTLPAGFEPFVFVDWGKLGINPASLDPDIFWDPGFGIRWQSPIGVIRGTVAQGMYPDGSSKTQFYFSYGEEF